MPAHTLVTSSRCRIEANRCTHLRIPELRVVGTGTPGSLDEADEVVPALCDGRIPLSAKDHDFSSIRDRPWGSTPSQFDLGALVGHQDAAHMTTSAVNARIANLRARFGIRFSSPSTGSVDHRAKLHNPRPSQRIHVRPGRISKRSRCPGFSQVASAHFQRPRGRDVEWRPPRQRSASDERRGYCLIGDAARPGPTGSCALPGGSAPCPPVPSSSVSAVGTRSCPRWRRSGQTR